ncbi:GHKL domain-containing protein [Amphibacillus sp. MSJ-3]|uniref:sensor histidine kinase n=1 Tax=Amphibacillus sp. MSJ-3 TaxID=2841505 RepID=UPI001C0F2321|nr:GHKL domain-containing protein [Amphibacillus sp. MSJ-3]
MFYLFTRSSRIFLDVPMVAIAGIIADNLSQVLLFSFFVKLDKLTLSINMILFLLFFAIFICLYQLFIEKVWHTFFIPLVSQLIIITTACLTVGVLYINLFISVSQNLYTLAMFNLIIEAVYFVLMFILSMVLLRNVKRENRLRQKATEHKQLHEYMESLERVNKDMQKFRHDYQNILLTMQGYIDHNDFQGLKSYFSERIVKVEERALKSNYQFTQLEKLELIELKGLFANKILLAEELGIMINMEVPDPIETIAMDIIDLTRIIGILVDNAIEASARLDKGELNIAIIKKQASSVLIVIENRVEPESFDINRIFELHYTTKDNHQGLGLKTVRQTLTNYPNVTMNTRIERDFFIQEIDIYPNKSTSPQFKENKYIPLSEL